MKTKALALLFCFLTSQYCFSQNFNEKEIKKFNSFKIDLNQIDLTEQKNISNLHLILKKEKFRKFNKNLGITLAIHSIISTLLGVQFILDGRSDVKGMSSGIGSVMLVGSAISGGFSIPFLISSKKRKKERNKLLKLF